MANFTYSPHRIVILVMKPFPGGSIQLVSERREQSVTSSEEREKELRRVYRKLKGVRCQISMKLRELEKEVRETRFAVEDDGSIFLEEHEEEEAPDEERIGDQEETQEKRLRAAQSEVKTLLDHKMRLRKRFQKLKEEVRSM